MMDEFEHEATAAEFEIVPVEEAGIDVTVPAPEAVDPDFASIFEAVAAESDASLEPSDDELYEEAIEEHEEEEEPVRANRWMQRAARRSMRKQGAGFTRKFRKGRMPDNMVEKTEVEGHEGAD